jgi:hypothetical protein
MSKAAGEVVAAVASNGQTSNGKPSATAAVKKGLPLLFMRTVILAVQGFPELKQYVAVGLLPRYACIVCVYVAIAVALMSLYDMHVYVCISNSCSSIRVLLRGSALAQAMPACSISALCTLSTAVVITAL